MTELLSSATIPHTYNGVLILQRGDGYWNATAMCQANGKRWHNYYRNQETQEFLQALSAEMRIPVARNRATEQTVEAIGLVDVVQGGPPALQGSWVHRRVALDLARWCSPTFAVKVNAWVDELLSRGRVELRSERPTLRPYTDRVVLLPGIRRNIPRGHWCVFSEAADLLIWAEHVFVPAGLDMQAYDLLDGSVGTHWARFREGQAWAGRRIPYLHQFPEGDRRGAREAWAYPMAELPYFREWLHQTYVPSLFPDYLQRKYGPQRLLQAAPTLRRLGLYLPNLRLQDN